MKRTIYKQIAALLLGGFLIGLTGCASVSVRKSEFARTDLQTPTRIFVRPFVVNEDAARVDRTGEELVRFEETLANDLADDLVQLLGKFVAPAEKVAAKTTVVGKNAWLIEGSFVRINQGSRFLRASVGLGVGGTKQETRASVFLIQPGKKPRLVATIETTGGSNAQPGAILSGPVLLIPRVIFISTTSGLSADTRRTARMITATLSEKLAKSNASLPERTLIPKRLGSLPTNNPP